MLIANPIYDSVFKFLMEDPEIARELLATIMQEDIIDIQLLPQEHTAGSARHLVSVFRVDFKATIKTAAGEQKKILIELQKGKQPIDVMRFRRYLGVNYSEPDTVDNRKVGLPIVTIYFLGFELSLKYPVLKINRVYTNVATGEIVEGKDDFVEQLTHDSYIVQIPQLPLVTQNKVEQVLSVFSQRWIGKSHVYSHWMYDYPTGVTDDKLLVKILSRLRKATLSPDVKEDIYIEEEIDESIDNIIRTKNLELLEK